MLLQDSFLFSFSEKGMNVWIQIPDCSLILESEKGPTTLAYNYTAIRSEDRGP